MESNKSSEKMGFRILKWVMARFYPTSPEANWPYVDRKGLAETAALVDKADLALTQVQLAQKEAELRNEAQRKARKLAQINAWSDPEAVKARYEEHQRLAGQALERGKILAAEIRVHQGLPAEDVPLPPLDQLPPEMRNQSPSTIRAMLSRRPEVWKQPERKKIFDSAEGMERCWRQERMPDVLS